MKGSWAKYSGGIAAILVLAASASGCGSAPEEVTATSGEGALLQVQLVREEAAQGLEPVEFDGDTLYLEPTPVFSDQDLQSWEPFFDSGELHVQLELTPEAGERVRSLTSEEIGSRLAVVIESEVRYTVVVRDGIGGRIQIPVGASGDEASRLEALFHDRWRRPHAP